MKRLYLVRGIPGSGKSAWAARHAAVILDPDMLSRECGETVEDADNRVLVFLSYAAGARWPGTVAITAACDGRRLRNFVETGHWCGYEVTVVDCLGDYGNVHGIPPEEVERAKKDFRPLDRKTVEEWGVALMSTGGDEPDDLGKEGK